jgi:hypothetical protein
MRSLRVHHRSPGTSSTVPLRMAVRGASGGGLPVFILLLAASHAHARAACRPGDRRACVTEGGCSGTELCDELDVDLGLGEWSGVCEPTGAPQPCDTCGAGGSRVCGATGELGPCRPAAVTPEMCGNGCDDDRDGEADEGCANQQTFDYCAANGDGTFTRWRCGCGEGLKVGYCLGAGDSLAVCGGPGGCLLAPGFASTGASQPGGNYACCATNLPCTWGGEAQPRAGYVSGAFQCMPAWGSRFECQPGTSCSDGNVCAGTCTGVALAVRRDTGDILGGGGGAARSRAQSAPRRKEAWARPA